MVPNHPPPWAAVYQKVHRWIRAGSDGAKRKKGTSLHIAAQTFGHLIAFHVTPADGQNRMSLERRAKAAQRANVGNVELA
jgi:hypothetical protein